MDPLDAFNWLIEQFRRYTQNQLQWQQVRVVLHEAEALRTRYHDFYQRDEIISLAMHLHERDRPSLHDCTDDFLWRKLIRHVERKEAADAAYLSMLLYQREIAPITSDL